MKRKADTFETGGAAGGAGAPNPQRVAQFTQDVRALNSQFSKWVASQATSNIDKLWDSGIRDYQKYAAKLRADYDDVVGTAAHAAEAEGGQLMMLGQGDMGQLGLGEDETEALRPMLVSLAGGLKAVQVACGGMHTVLLVEGGQVFSWGVNDEGALGRQASGGHLALMDGAAAGDETTPGRVAFPGGVRIKAVSAGDSHSAGISTSGAVFAWGVFRDSSGRFGFAPGITVQKTPMEVRVGAGGGDQVRRIASGSDHILALTASGAVYTWGCAELGRLGRLDAKMCDPKVQRDKEQLESWKAKLLTPTPLGSLGGGSATNIGCGLYCSFVITGSGGVYACGVNNYGQMGLDADGPFYTMTCVTALSGKGVVSVGGGEHHTLFLTTEGKVLSCGRATYGRLGRGGVDCNGDQKYSTPQQVGGFDSRVKLVVAGLSVSGAVTEEGSVYMWGSGGDGLLGKGGDDGDEHAPRKLATDANYKGDAIGLSIGGQHAALLVRSSQRASSKRQR